MYLKVYNKKPLTLIKAALNVSTYIKNVLIPSMFQKYYVTHLLSTLSKCLLKSFQKLSIMLELPSSLMIKISLKLLNGPRIEKNYFKINI